MMYSKLLGVVIGLSIVDGREWVVALGNARLVASCAGHVSQPRLTLALKIT